MNTELCKKCIHSKDAELHTNSVCEVCFRIDSIGHGENSHFLERREAPECCGVCEFCIHPHKNMFVSQQPYCSASKEFDINDRRLTMQFIRKNYLTKNTPKWCPFKRRD